MCVCVCVRVCGACVRAYVRKIQTHKRLKTYTPTFFSDTTRYNFIANTFQSLAENAVLGITLGVSLAFPVLVVSTCNVINGFLATLTICCVTVCVVGVIPLGGWKLGVGGKYE